MATLEPETTISHYKIKGLLGSGGMGEVYKAVDLQLGRVVALKTILPGRAADPNIYQRFLREARAASILTHPSICTIYEIGQEGDLTYIAMQYLEGKTIHTIISDFGPLPIETAIKYTLDVVGALEEAHRLGVIHRDIKPANILVNQRDHAVVLDFGLAKQVTFADGLTEELPTQMQITSTATLVGTGPYMPPEQIMGEALDARSDIFSLGVTIFEMLTGRRPFEGQHSVDVLHSILRDEPTPLTELRPEVDESLATIVAKALKKNRDERYQSASEIRADVEDLIEAKGYNYRGFTGSLSASLPVGLSRADLKTREIQTTTGPVTGPRVYLWPAVALLAVVALIGGAWWIFSSRDESDAALLSSLRHTQLVNWRREPGETYIRCALSRDGAMIAYSATRDGTTDIWVKQTLGEANPIKIASGLNPIWSSDNQQIAYVASRNNENGIWRVPALGGSPALIKVMPPGAELISWSSKRPVVYYNSGSDVFAVSVDSGQTEQVTNLNSSDAESFTVSPDEDKIAYVDRKDGQSDIWFSPRAGGPPVRITNDAAVEKNPVWHPDGKRIIYSSIPQDTYQLFVTNVDGPRPIQLTFGENDNFVAGISADGRKILYGYSKEESDIWGVKVDSGEEFEVTATAGVELWPDVSPDNKLVAFQATKQSQGRTLDTSTILIKPVIGGQPLQLSARGRDLKWSPDGSKLSFLASTGTMRNLWVVNPTGSDLRQLTTEGALESGNTVLPYNRKQSGAYNWSPDSQKIVFCNQKSNGEFQVALVSVAAGDLQVVSSSHSESFSSPIWSADSKRVLYSSRSTADSKWKAFVADLETGKSEMIYQGDRVMRLLGWSSSVDVLIATDERTRSISAKAVEISLFQIATGKEPKLIATVPAAYLYNIQLSPDGKTIAFTSHQDGRDNIWLIPAGGGPTRKLTANTDPRFYFSSLTWSPDGRTIYYGKQSGYSLISEISEFK